MHKQWGSCIGGYAKCHTSSVHTVAVFYSPDRIVAVNRGADLACFVFWRQRHSSLPKHRWKGALTFVCMCARLPSSFPLLATIMYRPRS
jgi:hypothetical protein